MLKGQCSNNDVFLKNATTELFRLVGYYVAHDG